MTDYPQSRKATIVVQDLESEVLIYDLSIDKAYCLNQTSALVFQLCDGSRTVAEISGLMSVKLKTAVSEDLVWLALEELKKDKLLEDADKLVSPFAGLTRREVVNRVGLASMVMLPLISSVVAPSAAMAQSNPIALFGACPTGSGCESGLTCRTCSGAPCSGGMTCCLGTNGSEATGSGPLSGFGGQADCASCYAFGFTHCCSGTGTPGSCSDPGIILCSVIC